MKIRRFTMAAAAVAVATSGLLVACGKSAGDKAVADSDSMKVVKVDEELAAEGEAPLSDSDVVEKMNLLGADSVAAKAEIKTTQSGLKYRVIKEGNGKSPSATDVVKVHYEGRLLNGNVFDSSYERGEAIEFPLNRVIPGWTEGVQLMKEGAIYEFLIPSELAYGKAGAPGAIPPDSDLLFKVELIKVR